MTENQMCVALIMHLRIMQTMNKTEGIWLHIPNEISNNKNPIFGSLLKKMGKLNGAPDYVFMWRQKVGFMEIKTKTGKVSSAQKEFEEHCKRLDLPYSLCRSVDECIDVLTKWGFLKN